MITDDERRNVAARLRELEHHYNKNWVVKCGELPAPVDDAMHVCCIDRLAYGSEICKRLADLIEPEPERTCQMDKSEFADFAPEYEGLYSCPKCGEETAVLACVNDGGDMEWMKPRFCGFCGAKVVEVVDE